MILLTRKQVAEKLGVSYRRAGDLMHQMATVQVGQRLRVTERELEDWACRAAEVHAGSDSRNNRKPARKEHVQERLLTRRELRLVKG